MAHTQRHKEKLIQRCARIRGQIEAVQRALESEEDCSAVLLNVAACRGALNSLMAEIIEGHIHEHVLDPDKHSVEQERAADTLIEIVRAYLK